MRAEYLPSETFCCFCGLIIKEKQIAGNMEGIMVHRVSPNDMHIDPLDVYLCDEHLKLLTRNIKGGIDAARRRTYELENSGRHEVGE